MGSVPNYQRRTGPPECTSGEALGAGAPVARRQSGKGPVELEGSREDPSQRVGKTIGKWWFNGGLMVV